MNSNPEISEMNADELRHCLIGYEKYIRIGQLAAGLAHNLQSPLTAIKGYAQLIQVDRSEIEEVQLILKEVEQIQKITHNLMIRTRALQDNSIKAIFLNDLIRNELEFLQTQMHFRHTIQKHVQLDPELPVITGVCSEISQIVFNLLLNGIQAMTNSTEKDLYIGTRHDDESVYIEVGDTGEKRTAALPESETQVQDEKIKCFNRPGEVNPAGFDLGLTIIRYFVQKYQGSFRVESDAKVRHSIVALPVHAP